MLSIINKRLLRINVRLQYLEQHVPRVPHVWRRGIQNKKGIGVPEPIVDKPPTYYQTLADKLAKMNYYEHAINLVDIGVDDRHHESQNVRQMIAQVEAELSTRDRLLDAEDEAAVQIDYRRLYDRWYLSPDGQRSIIELANHYGIFRDLFPSPPLAVSPIEEPPPRPIFYFHPLVPIRAQFFANACDIVEDRDVYELDDEKSEKQDESDNDLVIISTAYRGNLIMPAKCANTPNVVIDCCAINGINNSESSVTDSETLDDQHIKGGKIKLLGNSDSLYTLALISLDSICGEHVCCHWLASNIHTNNKGITSYETAVKYLPVFGINGLGYHRYVFLLYRHSEPLNLEPIIDYDLVRRKLNFYKFISDHQQCRLTPIGLSWFQTTWDYSCQRVFWDYLDMRSPVYEYEFPKDLIPPQEQFPRGKPFNIYLDTYRDPKEVSKEVLLERLSEIHPYKYQNVFDVKDTPPQIYKLPPDTPSWIKDTIVHRREKSSKFRGLRPPSAVRPLNNNIDLDRPIYPRQSPKTYPLMQPSYSPDRHRRPKPLKETLWVKPAHEHPTYRIAYPENLNEEDCKNVKESD